MKHSDTDIILIATANSSDFDTLQAQLQNKGFESVECVDGIDLIRKSCILRPRAVIIDINIRNLNAFQCARILKNDPVLNLVQRICVSPTTPLEQYWATFCGFDHLLPFPFEEETTYRIIDLLSRKKSKKRLLLPESLLTDLDDTALFNMALSLAEHEMLKANILNEINLIDVVSLAFHDLIYAVMSILNSLFDFDIAAVMIIHQKDDDIIF